MSETATSIRVVIPLTLRKRNGRPKILPPEDAGLPGSQGQEPHVLRAIARAWKWRRQLEEGEMAGIQDIAAGEKIWVNPVQRENQASIGSNGHL